jgi:hypothetical protein
MNINFEDKPKKKISLDRLGELKLLLSLYENKKITELSTEEIEEYLKLKAEAEEIIKRVKETWVMIKNFFIDGKVDVK